MYKRQVLAIEVVDDFLGAAVNDRPVGDDVIGRPAQVFKGQCVGQERLDRGAGLFKLAGRPVQQPRSGIIPAAPQSADLTGLVVHRDDCDLHQLIRIFDILTILNLSLIHI